MMSERRDRHWSDYSSSGIEQADGIFLLLHFDHHGKDKRAIPSSYSSLCRSGCLGKCTRLCSGKDARETPVSLPVLDLDASSAASPPDGWARLAESVSVACRRQGRS
jgi:hypothetical protein